MRLDNFESKNLTNEFKLSPNWKTNDKLGNIPNQSRTASLAVKSLQRVTITAPMSLLAGRFKFIIPGNHSQCHVSCQETSGDRDWTLASTYVLRLCRASCPELAEGSQTTAE